MQQQRIPISCELTHSQSTIPVSYITRSMRILPRERSFLLLVNSIHKPSTPSPATSQPPTTMPMISPPSPSTKPPSKCSYNPPACSSNAIVRGKVGRSTGGGRMRYAHWVLFFHLCVFLTPNIQTQGGQALLYLLFPRSQCDGRGGHHSIPLILTLWKADDPSTCFPSISTPRRGTGPLLTRRSGTTEDHPFDSPSEWD